MYAYGDIISILMLWMHEMGIIMINAHGMYVMNIGMWISICIIMWCKCACNDKIYGKVMSRVDKWKDMIYICIWIYELYNVDVYAW